MENPYFGGQFGGFGAKYPRFVSHVFRATKVFTGCANPRILTYFAPKSAAAFEFKMENPLFGGNFGGFGGKVPLNLGPMDFVPKSIHPCAKTRLLTYCAPKSAAAFSKKLLDPLSVTYDLEK